MRFSFWAIWAPCRLLFSGILLTAAAAPATAQTASAATAAAPIEKVYTFVEEMPQPPGGGGNVAIVRLIQQQVVYPRRAMLAHAEGRVFVSFTVAPTGLIEDVGITKGFRSDCDSVVLQAVKQLPRFEPGKQVGRPVPVRFTVPVTFRLQAPQPVAQEPASFPDSTQRVYTYIEHMPLYRGQEGTKKLTSDLLREFRAASAAGGCAVPAFPVFVALTIGPSGVIYDVKVINNLPATATKVEVGNGTVAVATPKRTLQELPPACEAALVGAARKLPRLTPGTQNGRRVAVSYTLHL